MYIPLRKKKKKERKKKEKEVAAYTPSFSFLRV
jgi:hypothetical protein